MKKINIIVFAALVMLILSSCGQTDASQPSSYDWLPEAKSPDEILLYDRFNQRFVTYNVKTYAIVNKNNSPNYFQYEFNDPESTLFTTGHSLDNHFKIIRKNDRNTTVLVTMDPSEGIFPLTIKDKNTAFFLKTLYDATGGELTDQRAIYKMDIDQNKLNELTETRGLSISKGIYYDHMLYFTTYNDKDDSYSLYRIKDSNEMERPELLQEKLESSDLYVSEGHLCLSSSTQIMCGEKRFPKRSLNYFYKDTLIQIYVGKDADTTGDLMLSITDVKTGKEKARIGKVIDFKLNGEQMSVYTHGAMYTVDLATGQIIKQ